MEYKELVGRLKAISDIFKFHTGMDNYIEDAATAITDLLARAEAAEARAEKAEKEVDQYKQFLQNWHEHEEE